MAKTKPKNQNKRVFWRNFFFVFVVVVTFLYLAAGYFYENFYPNTKVFGAELRGISKTDAKEILKKKEDKLLAKKIIVQKSDGEQISSTLSAVGFYYDTDEELKNLYSLHNFPQALRNLFCESCALTIFKPKINETKLSNFLNIKVANVESDPTLPQVYIENGVAKVHDGKPGEKPDLSTLREQITEINPQSRPDFRFDLVFTNKPPMPANSPYILQAMEKINELISRQIVFHFEDKTFTMDKVAVGNLLNIETRNDEVKYDFSQQKIWEYVNYLNDQIYVAPIDKLMSYKGEVIDEGADGRTLDQNDAYAKIQSGLKQLYSEFTLLSVVVPKGEAMTSPDDGPSSGMYPGKYIEVDLSQQMLYTINGKNVDGGYSVSTGAWDMPTPIGTFSVLSKSSLAWSDIGFVWMPWWMQFTGQGHGIHELPYWPDGTREGENNLGYAVSHGCIRLGIGPAETVYNWTPEGTPVVVHN